MGNMAIAIEDLKVRPYQLFENQWLLLTSGDFSTGKYNAMTIAWGSMGSMWSKPFVQVVVRPTRYTYEFMNKYPTFTVCAFPKEYRKALALLGARSGRDSDKISEAGITAVAGQQIAAPTFLEASLTLECVKNYWADMVPENFLDETINQKYAEKDYHRIYFGEIKAIYGDTSFYSK
jgi:flavin reductase (DIM6/NTAB) family NADH-FMN oxidoreductase RutF